MEHTNRTIRPLTQQDLAAYLDIYLNAYPTYKTLGEAPSGAAGGPSGADGGPV